MTHVRRWGFLAMLVGALTAPGIAQAHIERASYWPDPAPDCSISPCTGGEVPTPRTLASALLRKQVGVTRVVCQPDSITRLRKSLAEAKKVGYRRCAPRSRASRSPRRKPGALLNQNKLLFKRCAYDSIQAAVTASGNNDRVVIMPGLYTEPRSREAPTHDPACAQYQIENDRGETGAVSYEYQYHCPNDQNLIAVMGRAPGATPAPQPPLSDRHGIPDLGPCIRCNLQIEGSGVSADDVTIDAGDASSGDHGPLGSAKDVGIRADRADGFVLRNVTVRHAKEHDIYVLETDGYLLDRFKTFYAGEYGVLTFVEDHGLMQNCEAAGNGDSGLYPGAGADTGNQRETSIYPAFRYSQEIRFCDSHHNAGGYSGTDGNAVHVHDNNFYDNALGFTTDVFTAAGHPGFPQDSDLIENNNFYSNNFNPYAEGSDVAPSVPAAGRHRAVDRRRQRRRRPRQPLLRQLAPRHDAVRGARPGRLRTGGGRPVTARRLQPDGRAALDLLPRPVLRKHHGQGARWHRAPQRHRRRDHRAHGLLVGPVRRQHGQLLARQHRPRRHGCKRHEHPAGTAAAEPVRRHERRHGRPRTAGRAAQLPRRHNLRYEPVPVVHDTL